MLDFYETLKVGTENSELLKSFKKKNKTEY